MESFARGSAAEGVSSQPFATLDPSSQIPLLVAFRWESIRTVNCITTPIPAEENHIVAVLGEHVPDTYLHELRLAGVSYLFAGSDGSDLPVAMERLAQDFGIRSILLEGGGLINGAFLKAGLINEVSLLVYPAVDGLAGVPSVFEYAGADDERPAADQSLRHLATETLSGGMVWLRYCVESSEA